VAEIPGVGIPGDVADLSNGAEEDQKPPRRRPYQRRRGKAKREQDPEEGRTTSEDDPAESHRWGKGNRGKTAKLGWLETAATARQERKNQMSRYLGFMQKLGSRR